MNAIFDWFTSSANLRPYRNIREPTLKKLVIAFVAVISVSLSGCSSLSEGDKAIQSVKDLYEARCLSKFGIPIEYRYEEGDPSGFGDGREATVYASMEPYYISYSVRKTSQGGFLIQDSKGNDWQLASVGC